LPAVANEAYVYGDNHCFYFDVPLGWVGDNKAGESQGLAFVFYPVNKSWSNATTVIYARVADKSEDLKEPKDQVARTLQQFRTEYESPNIEARKVSDISSGSGAKGEIYKFTGDKWGNTEYAAYFTGKDTINFFVMTSRDARDLENNLLALNELAKSYREADNCKPCDEVPTPSKEVIEALEKLPSTLEEAKKIGDEHEHGEETRNYHLSTLMPYFGNKYAGIIKNCFDTITIPDTSPFTFVVAIDAHGKVLRIYQDIETNIFRCMHASLINDNFPKPPVAPYFMSIDMEFTP